MTISVRLSNDETVFIKKYAELKGLSVSELVRQSVLERIEDEFDLKTYEEALAEYHETQVAYALDDVERELGLK